MSKKTKRNWLEDILMGLGFAAVRIYVNSRNDDSSKLESARINLMRDMLAAAVLTGDPNKISSILEVIADMEKSRKFTEEERAQIVNEVRQMLLKNLDEVCKKGLQSILDRFINR